VSTPTPIPSRGRGMRRRWIVLTILVALGAFVSWLFVSGSTRPIHEAAFRGDSKRLEVLLVSGSDPNQPAGSGWSHKDRLRLSPLHWAIEGRHAEVIPILVRHGARLDQADAFGMAPLRRAVWRHYPEAVEALLAAGAPTEQKDLDGKTPLMRALEAGYFEESDALIRHGASLKAVDPFGNDILSAAIAGFRDDLGARDRILIAMLERGLDPDNRVAAHFGGQVTLLMIAAEQGRRTLAQAALDAGASPELMDGKGRTALQIAVAAGHDEILALLRRWTEPLVPSPR